MLIFLLGIFQKVCDKLRNDLNQIVPYSLTFVVAVKSNLLQIGN